MGSYIEDDREDPTLDGEYQDDDALTDPDSGNIITRDERHWYQYGKLVLETSIDNADFEVQQFMEREQFHPDVIFVNDHGNVDVITARIGEAECQHERDEKNADVEVESDEAGHWLSVSIPCKFRSVGCDAWVLRSIGEAEAIRVVMGRTSDSSFVG